MKEEMKRVFRTDKPVVGMLHLRGFGPNEIQDHAKHEIEIYYKYGVDAVLVEDYFGTPADAEHALEYLQAQYPDRIYGVNLLGDPEKAFVLARQYGASFIQLDSVCGHLRPGARKGGTRGSDLRNQTCDEDFANRLAELRALYPVFLLGGVRFKYQPVLSKRSTEEDIALGMARCSAIVVTGAGTGIETGMEKIRQFRNVLGSFPLFIGAGMTADTCREQLAVADGAIVGSWFKRHGMTGEPVDAKRVREFMEIVKDIRSETV